jgi:hypothetical protein
VVNKLRPDVAGDHQHCHHWMAGRMTESMAECGVPRVDHVPLIDQENAIIPLRFCAEWSGKGKGANMS